MPKKLDEVVEKITHEYEGYWVDGLDGSWDAVVLLAMQKMI